MLRFRWRASIRPLNSRGERSGSLDQEGHLAVTSLPPLSTRRLRLSFEDAATVRALALITFGVFVLRLPSLFEPPWYTDEGIFAAVAQRVLEGGRLYSDAWESKPPLFLYLYAATFKVFGPGTFGIHLMATLSAVGTHFALFFVARRFMSRGRALFATACCGFLLGVPFWEGTLALTEIFTVFPTALAVLCLLKADEASGDGRSERRLLLLSGAFFGVAFLIRQTSIAAAVAGGVWLLLRGRPWLRRVVLGGAGFALIVAPVVAAFAAVGDFHWFWDANVTFFFQYVPSGQQLPFGTRPVILMPFLVAVTSLALARLKRKEIPVWALPAFWLSLTLAGALLTGRPYAHYLLQMFPPLALLAGLGLPSYEGLRRASFKAAPAYLFVAALLIEWSYVVVPMYQGNLLAMHYTRSPFYYANFAGWVLGLRSQEAYEDFFDKRVRLTRSLEQALEQMGAEGQKVYIWGEYPWVYPLADVTPTTRYMTSFYFLLRPHLDAQLARDLVREEPTYIIVMSDARPNFRPRSAVIDERFDTATRRLNVLLARNYKAVKTVGRAAIYRRLPDRPDSVSGLMFPGSEEVAAP